MPRPQPTLLYHFTHVDNLPAIAAGGLLCQTAGTERCSVEAGNRRIKARRSARPVPVAPRGVVADYAPFYFAPRSPMLSAIHNGQVPEYAEGQDPLAYLVTTVERLVATGAQLVFTDRNAVLDLARFTTEVDDLDGLVDWQLMRARYWFNTPDDPDRKERRMAECLVHEAVPWDAFIGVAARNRMRQRQAKAALGGTSLADRVEVRPGWYF
ncbi:MAG: type II toxin-antitoxin system toxin DNA ADP-ribosyl transferase DarT [Acidimicrobiales bacterium]